MGKSLYCCAVLSLVLFSTAVLIEEEAHANIVSTANSDADLDDSGIVDYLDLQVLARNWLWSGQPPDNVADLDLDGIVDFNDFSMFAAQWLSKKRSVAIFIDLESHLSLQTEVERLKADIENDLGVQVFVLADNWSSIRSVKDILTDMYARDGLIGAVLIGEIPAAYFEYQDSGSTPSDWYFQDLSDKFVDSDGDGKFEREHYISETDVTMRDIWVGRIKPPLGGTEGIEMLRSYLDRDHSYRTGELQYERKMLYFGSVAINQTGVSEQEYFDLVNQVDDYTRLYESDADVNAIYSPSLLAQKDIYLSELSNSYDFVFVNIHGSVTTQWLGDATSVYHDEVRDAQPEVLFSVMASCSNGNFTQENYFAGWYLFSGNSLAVMGNTVPAMLVGSSSVEFLKDYIPLGLGVTFGEMCKNDRSFLVSHLLGDPTLTLRPKPTGEQPALRVDASHLDFGDVERGTKAALYISFENEGTAVLEVSLQKARSSIDGEWVNLGYWDVFQYKHPETGELFRDFTVRAAQEKIVTFIFYPRADGPAGRYSMTILFQTNDPESPYVGISLVGNAI